MKDLPPRTLSLSLDADPAFLPTVTQFVETVAALFGLGREEVLKLRLAAEEIFVYLSNIVCPGKALEVRCLNGLYYARVLFLFSAPEINLRGLNIASSMNLDHEADLEEMGLMIASRSVDHLHIAVEKNKQVCLAVTKERAYPRNVETLPLPETAEKIALETPDRERLKRFAVLVAQSPAHSHAEPSRPSFFSTPGKVADMAASGEVQAVVALNARKEIVGGVLFRQRSEKIVECFGPYAFHREKEAEINGVLLQACIGRIARSKALGLLSLSGLPDSLRPHFETLGSLDVRGKGLAPVRQTSYYRHLHEDPGSEVWSCAELTPYLQGEYDRLVLAREIRNVQDMGETRSGSSLFAADVGRERSEATLRPLWPGADFAANVKRHVRFLQSDGFLNLFFELDLGVPWHAEIVPALLAHGFQPAIILPFAGQSDLILFQHHDATES